MTDEQKTETISKEDERIDSAVDLLAITAMETLNKLLADLCGDENAAAVVITVHTPTDGSPGSVAAVHSQLKEESLSALLKHITLSREAQQ